ncbi:MAG: toxin TcdB middle/N-terminal domain-containing protein, partial [Deltaproteobacteria bacterium]|nr:toxin TcdB middle/N-terminal domain-containing protein [Deltaproteobacteria bacterium]
EGISAPTPSFGFTEGRNATEVTLTDLNGDGLVDHVRLVRDLSDPLKPAMAVEAQFNLGNRLGRPVRIDGRMGRVVETLGATSLESGFETETTTSDSAQFGVYGTGAGLATTARRTLSMLVDVTGDGLPDHVEVSGSSWAVSVNTGAGFAAPRSWSLSAFDAGAGIGPGDSAVLARGVGSNFNGSVGGAVELVFPVLRLTLQGSLSRNSSESSSNMTLRDINGDGLVDHVAQTADGRLFARINPIGPSNRLVRIRNPFGGRIELAYQSAGNVAAHSEIGPDGVAYNVHMPRSQWVLASVDTWDNPSSATTPGHYTHTTFDYHQSGYYDPDERENYGFRHLTVTGTDGSLSEMYFHNQDYFRRGRLYASVGVDSSRHAWTRAGISWTAPLGAPAPRTSTFSPEKSSETAYVLDGSSLFSGASFATIAAIKSVTKTFEYRSTGEVKAINDPGDADGNDDLRVDISYADLPGLNLALPSEITVRSWPSLAILRQRTASYRSNGTMESIRDRLAGGINPDTSSPWVGNPSQDPTTHFDFDAFGNLSATVDPSGFQTTIEYDSLTRSRPTRVHNSFNLESTTQYDDRWAAPITQTDANGQSVSYTYDAHGRVATVTGPNDHGSAEPTLRFIHSTVSASSPDEIWAITDHKDSAHPGNPIRTVSFVDGFGRARVTKRENEVELGGAVEPGFMVNGATIYDWRGRVVQASQPWFSIASATAPVSLPMINPTLTTYDFLDRPLTVTGPDGAVTTYSYGHEVRRGVDRLTTTVTDALGRTATSYRRLDGQVTDLRQANTLNGTLTDLWTTYLYTELGQLSRVSDSAVVPHHTTAQYDSLGRMISLENPDTGLVEYRFTAAGDLGAKITPNLRAMSSSAMIRYNRSWHRLDAIDYPTSTDVQFVYGSSTDLPARRGRLVQRTDDSGEHHFVYGPLGEVVATHSELVSESGIGLTVADTHYTYDSFGRLRSILYPDEELVSYEYNAGGLLRRVYGDAGKGPRDYVSEIRYDTMGQRSFIRYGNGVTSRYNTNPLTRRMDSLETDSPVAGALQRLNYGYTATGNLSSIWTAGVGAPAPNLAQVWQSFSYDDLDQLTYGWGYYMREGGAQHSYSLSMQYDRIHNITQNSQSVWMTPGGGAPWGQVAATSHNNTYLHESSRPHAATNIGGRKFGFDDNGNQSFSIDPNTGSVRTMVWDDDDHLQQVIEGGSTVSFRYDSSGTRTHKVSSSGVTVYANQYYSVRNGALATKHVFAGSQRIASVVGVGASEQRLFLHTNHLGSTEFVTDSSGNVAEHYEQLPFGESWVEESGS